MPATKSAAILKLSGAFQKDPQRAREDLPGAGPFNPEPPEHLPGDCIPAWRYLVARVPKVTLSSSDETALEQATRLYAALRTLPVTSREWKGLNDSFVTLLGQLGMTPAARAKLGTSAKDAKPSKFSALKDDPA